MAITNENLGEFDGKMGCDHTGEGAIVKDIALGMNQYGKTQVMILATLPAYLRNPLDTRDGADPFLEPVEASDGIDIEEADKKLFYKRLNEIFAIQPPLEDTGDDELLRFTEDHPDSVVPFILGKRVYFKVGVKPSNNPKYPPTVRTTMWKVKPRETVTAQNLKAALEAKKREKELKAELEAKKARELEDAFA